MKAFRFRSRLFVILSLFALVPALALTVVWGMMVSRAIPLFSGSAAWERLAETGQRAIGALGAESLDPSQLQALREHEQELEESITQAHRFRFLAGRLVPIVLVTALVTLVVLWIAASRMAGHLSRQMSRPLDELVGWTSLIQEGRPLPDGTPLRGAPEFRLLRERMRAMAAELATGRARELEAERLRAFRETARRVAHELKNPLTPIQFAVARLRRDALASQGDALDVIETETRRLDAMARSFAQFGHLSLGPVSDVDLVELARYTALATVAPPITVDVVADDALPMIAGHHDALQRAVSNVLLNAAEACAHGGHVSVRVEPATLDGSPAVALSVADTGEGIDPDRLPSIWDPYVTSKAGGTGLGLAIARQTILAHGGVVSAESTPGMGTTIRLTLPSAASPPPSPSPSGVA